MNKIKRVSRFFRIIFQLLLIALPIAVAVGWMNAPEGWFYFLKFDVIPREYSSHIFHQLTASEKLLGFIVSTIPMMVHLFILYTLVKLFRLFEQGIIFSLENVNRIRNIGYALLIGEIINPFYQIAMGFVLTLHNPPGKGFIGVTFAQNEIGTLLTAFLIILISWIMTEGCKLSDEQQLTV